jgi:aryl-alcohol dehydrogenase-like predicted oxidoreductase
MPKFNSETARMAAAKSGPRGESKAKKWLREAADRQTTIKVFEKLTELANNGDMDAIKTYLAYVVGKPKETVALVGDAENPIVFKLDERFLNSINGG